MTTEAVPALPVLPSWLRVCLAVVSALAVFRACKLILGYALLLVPGRVVPLSIQHFLYRWDTLLVPLIAVVAAVLFSRWFETRMMHKSRSAAVVVAVAFAVAAFLPVTVRFEVKPVMASPVLIAIQRDYPVETVAAMLDRYPHLANASEDDWGRIQPLVEAACERKTNMVELLIRKGADIDAAVENLMQIDAREAVALVLMCAESHNQSVEATADPPSS